MYRLLEHSANYLGSSRPRVPSKISPRLTIIVPLRPKIYSVLNNYLGLPLFLLLVPLYPFVLINTIHELVYTPNELPRQRLP